MPKKGPGEYRMTHYHDAIKLIKEVGQGCYLAKTDIKEPFVSFQSDLRITLCWE